MSDNTNAAIILPPTETDRAVTNTAISTTTTSAINTSSTGQWFTFSAIGTDVYILFGTSAVSNATTSNGFVIPNGSTVSFYIPKQTTYFKAIAATGSGTLSWYRSS